MENLIIHLTNVLLFTSPFFQYPLLLKKALGVSSLVLSQGGGVNLPIVI